jgi:biopolymer transport protein ExbD
MSVRKRRKKRASEYRDIELNIMPFIDVFSLLNTFLLFSAAFFSLGMFEVQLPFFSNSPETKETKPTRDLDVKVNVEREKIELTTSYTLPPTEEKTDNFSFGKEDLDQLHRKLVELRKANEDLKKLSLYCEDDVIYEDLTKVLDVVKSRYENDPVLYTKDDKTGERVDTKDTLFPQVVMGSVIL